MSPLICDKFQARSGVSFNPWHNFLNYFDDLGIVKDAGYFNQSRFLLLFWHLWLLFEIDVTITMIPHR